MQIAKPHDKMKQETVSAHIAAPIGIQSDIENRHVQLASCHRHLDRGAPGIRREHSPQPPELQKPSMSAY
jgi:hypothetical protein